jgi:uncharacterized protein (TIGR02246 family)
MKALEPAQIHECFEKALVAADLDALLAIYEPDAVVVPEAGQVLKGTDAIREHLAGLIAMKPQLKSETTVTVQSGDIAMLRARWTMKFVTAEGEAVVEGESTEIVRRQSDGGWKCLIDNPYSA